MTSESILSTLHLRRNSPVKPFMQLKSQFEYEVVTGRILPGDKLPSVREVASALGVSPTTVTRAYRELETAGLAVSHPGAGFFVLPTDESQSGPHGQIRARAAEFLDDAVREGVPVDQVLQILLAEIAEMRAKLAHLDLVLICKRDGRREELAMHLRHALLDLRVEVTPVALEDVGADIDGWLPRLKKARHVLCLAFDLKEIQSLLAVHDIGVVPILGTLREDVQERLTSLEPGTRVGVIASSPEFVDGMISAVTGHNPSVSVIGGLACQDIDEIPQLLATADCIVHGTLARRTLESLHPLMVQTVELIYVPADSWTERFRRLLRSEMGT